MANSTLTSNLSVSTAAVSSAITSVQGAGFLPGTDDLHALQGVMAAMASGTSLAAVQSSINTSISGLATAANLATLQTTVNNIQTGVNAIKTHLGI